MYIIQFKDERVRERVEGKKKKRKFHKQKDGTIRRKLFSNGNKKRKVFIQSCKHFANEIRG